MQGHPVGNHSGYWPKGIGGGWCRPGQFTDEDQADFALKQVPDGKGMLGHLTACDMNPSPVILNRS